MNKRIFDICVCTLAATLLIVPCLLLAIAIRLTSKGPALFWSDRVGKDNKIFRMPKFRTMRTDTPHVATHLLSDPAAYITPLGKKLRKSSMDELPQVWSILIGHMSIVGPRPALYNQDDLIALRTQHGVHKLRPGITGLAQIQGRDDISIEDKVALDKKYMDTMSVRGDVKLIWDTCATVLRSEGVKH
jgi:O-antigen biosynthesis protein WbqP|tara:strand:+ start:305 stop:868 length:564 start_codon:yes stop_codon:yes gene_type:complete